jgi:phage terminase large subunit-like protein
VIIFAAIWRRLMPIVRCHGFAAIVQHRKCEVAAVNFKPKEHNDLSVGTTWYVTNNGYQLVDLIRARQEYPDLKRTIIMLQISGFRIRSLLRTNQAGRRCCRISAAIRSCPSWASTPQDKALRARAD